MMSMLGFLKVAFTPIKSLASVFFLSAFLLSGCSSLYIFQAAYEEGKILWRREPIKRQLQDPNLPADTREKFKLVLAVRDYARDAVKLKVGGSYSSTSYVDRPVLAHVLMAVPKTDLRPYTWWYLFVGEVPYKGFFSEEAAKADAASFEALGYDTGIRSSPAFSTLGWFNDPLLNHLLQYDKVTLAEVIFHELLHNTLFVKGAVDFNESLANFVGNHATIEFFRDRHGEESAEHRAAAQRWKEELEFSGFLSRLADSLRALYGKNIPEEEKLRRREEIFAESQKEWARRTASQPAHRFRGFSQLKLNNAVIFQFLLYTRQLDLFDSVYEKEGRNLARFIDAVRKALREGGDPFTAVRSILNP